MSGLTLALAAIVITQARDTLYLVETQRIPGDGQRYFFDQIVDLDVGSGGTVSVLLPAQQRVAMFDETGRFQRMIGRSGSGPGEFRFPITAGWLADTLWIWDGGLGRFSLWDEDGTFVRSINVVGNSAVALLRDGSALLARREIPQGGRLGPSMSRAAPMHFVRWAPETRDQDTIASLLFREASLLIGVGSGGYHTRQPFASNPMFKASPSGAALFLIREAANADGMAVEIVKVNAAGDTVFARNHPFVPTLVPDHAIDSTVNALVDRLTRSAPPQIGRPSISASAIREDLEIPDHLPPVVSAVVNGEGGIWLKYRTTYKGRSVWHSFDSVGDYVGAIMAPPDSQIMRVYGDQVWGIETDELDVPSVVRYRVSKS